MSKSAFCGRWSRVGGGVAGSRRCAIVFSGVVGLDAQRRVFLFGPKPHRAARSVCWHQGLEVACTLLHTACAKFTCLSSGCLRPVIGSLHRFVLALASYIHLYTYVTSCLRLPHDLRL